MYIKKNRCEVYWIGAEPAITCVCIYTAPPKKTKMTYVTNFTLLTSRI